MALVSSTATADHEPLLSEGLAGRAATALTLAMAGGLIILVGVRWYAYQWDFHMFYGAAVDFILKRDHGSRIRFAPLQGETAKSILQRHNLNTDPLKSVIFVENHGTESERIWLRSDAALKVFHALGDGWALLAGFQVVPRFLRDSIYDAIATSRYRWFGREESCRVPGNEFRGRFLP